MLKSLVKRLMGRSKSSKPIPHGTNAGSKLEVHIEDTRIQPSNDKLEIISLPNEILYLIFLYARNLSLIPTPRSLTAQAAHPIELAISHVCRLWRTMSLNYPPLWDTFRYVVPIWPQVKSKDRFAAYIERSGSLLLDIWINFRGHNGTRLNDPAEMFTMLLSQVDRWRRVTILLNGNPSFVHRLKGLHPVNLEHFAVLPQNAAYNSLDSRGLFKPNTFTSGARKLKSVRLITTTYDLFLPPLAHLTTFRLEKQYNARHIQINLPTVLALLAIPTLENLSVIGIKIFDDDNLKYITLERLQDFRCGGEDLAQILPYIQAPRLHSLTLRGGHFPILNPKFVPELTNLILLNCRVPWPELFSISSGITQLTVSENSEGTFHLHAPTIFELTTCWPQLTTLSCNLQFLSYIDLYRGLALSRVDQLFTVRVHQNLLDTWNDRTPDLLPYANGVPLIKSWDDDTNPLIAWHWPYAEDRAEYPFDKTDYDPFMVNSFH
ncbi:hypothetical protein GALMADRAFT_264276 [Galerina marginata CBS 339.88]|uniref:Uncharacterized protein n=1 Tax=Galerina marginata (strain CBS 339.88) TaxID=685588 RepID=A0A067TSS1_GALM3|nr:hypothetical protein GALMADRAFT_264276 [Galerina marginata CBS 339.88]